MSNLWLKIKRARKLAKLTQQEVADHIGISRNAVSAWESQNNDSLPTQRNLEKFMKLTGTKPADLFDESLEPSPEILNMLEEAEPEQSNPIPIGYNINPDEIGVFTGKPFIVAEHAPHGFMTVPASNSCVHVLRIIGSTLDPRYRHLEYLVLNPELGHEPGQDVVVYTDDGLGSIGELVSSDEYGVEIVTLSKHTRKYFDTGHIVQVIGIYGVINRRAPSVTKINNF